MGGYAAQGWRNRLYGIRQKNRLKPVLADDPYAEWELLGAQRVQIPCHVRVQQWGILGNARKSDPTR